MDQRQDINIGGVTAYAYARSKGYTGTEAEFAQLMANIGNTQQEIEATIDEFVNTTVPGAVQTVETAQTSAQEAIGISKTDALDAINTSKGSAVAAVNSAGDTQKAAVDAEGQRVIDLIPADYTELTDEVDDLKNAVIEITYSGDIVAHETGKYINNNGAIANYDIFSYSELYPVKTGDKITATLACPSGFWSIWYATEGYATKERAVQGGGWNAVEQTLVSDRDGYVCFSYVTAQPHTVKIETSIIQEIEREIDSLQDAVEPLTPTEYDTTIPTHESGKYLTLGGINEWAPYSYSEPIPVTKGDFIEITAYIGPRIYAYYCADLDYSFRQNAFVGDAYEVKSYSFVAEKTCYLAVNFQTAYTHTIKINGNPLKRDAFTNPLLGKTVVWCGDSIMKGNTWNDSNSGWAGRCADILSFHFKNYAVGGSTICNNVPNGATPTIYTQIETAHTEYPDADYIIFDGGCNDADLIGSIIGGTIPAQFGSFSPTDWSGNYDTDTFCGAMETICMHLSQYWLGKHVGYIVPQKQGVTNDYSAAGNNRRAYYETAIQICKKWGIAILNLWDGCYMNPKHNWMCDTDNTMTAQEIYDSGFLYADRQHLTAAGYDYQSAIVAEWIKGL